MKKVPKPTNDAEAKPDPKPSKEDRVSIVKAVRTPLVVCQMTISRLRLIKKSWFYR